MRRTFSFHFLNDGEIGASRDPEADSEGERKNGSFHANNLGGGPAGTQTAAGTKDQRVKGIEPSSVAWKATALPLSYTRALTKLPRLAAAAKFFPLGGTRFRASDYFDRSWASKFRDVRKHILPNQRRAE